MHRILTFFMHGGVFMIPLLICSLVSITFILERGFALRRKLILQQDLKRAIDKLTLKGPLDEIERLAAPQRSVLARLVIKCLDHLPWSKAENVESLQTAARNEMVQMERGLVVLEITVGLAPLLGLLGTISGLISIFEGIGTEGLASEGIVIARGIAEALNTTVGGLIVAIPALIAHSYYSKKVETLAAELENISMDLLAKLYLGQVEEEA